MPKRVLRASMLEARQRLSRAEQDASAALMLEALTSLREYAAARSVALYVASYGEVPTGALINRAIAAGKAVLLPAVTTQGVVFRRITTEADLVRGRYGIQEPPPYCKALEPSEIDLFVIPGVAFDLSGKRIGYGKGYYDRALHNLENSGKLIGLCYDFQLVDVIVGEPHDVVMDLVITERRVVAPRTAKIERENK